LFLPSFLSSFSSHSQILFELPQHTLDVFHATGDPDFIGGSLSRNYGKSELEWDFPPQDDGGRSAVMVVGGGEEACRFLGKRDPNLFSCLISWVAASKYLKATR